MKKLFLSILVFTGIGLNAFAQQRPEKELAGDKYFFNYSFDKAIEAYSQIQALSVTGQERLAQSYHNLNQNKDAEAVYRKLMGSPKGIASEDYYDYAMVLKINGKYDESCKQMDEFLAKKPYDLRAKDYAAHKSELLGLLKDKGQYQVNHLKINTAELDFGASYFKDRVVFASTRTDQKMIVRKYNWTGQPFWELYISDKDGEQLKNPRIFDKTLNQKLHVGPASFSRDGNSMAFTANNPDAKKKDGEVTLQIYFSHFINEKWTEPESFVFNDPKYSFGHPSLSADGNMMYFTSDMPNGFGGADIYKTRKNTEGEWSIPENMGDKINTEGDELFPFYEENNQVLFFASDGRFGLGGLDIFLGEMNGTGVGSVYNAGFPINTQYDDFAAITDSGMSKGFLSSNRSGGSGGDDIYSFEIKKWKPAVQPEVLFSVIAPINVQEAPRIMEIFPLRNYVFFDAGSTEIPKRYLMLSKDRAETFSEFQPEWFAQKGLADRSQRQMNVYYNLLNILGDRMRKSPSSNIRFVGSSEKGPEDALMMARTVKRYLVDIFGIESFRIEIEGRDKPKIASLKSGGTKELQRLGEEDRRVSVESDSPALLREFLCEPDGTVKPVETNNKQEPPLNTHVSFQVTDNSEILTSWGVELRDISGVVLKFGPFTQKNVSISSNSILGTQSDGVYKVTMTAQTNTDGVLKKDTAIRITYWSPAIIEEIKRYSIIYEFNDSKTSETYDKFLSEVVMPRIPEDGTITINGHTDIIGDEMYNQKLSLKRATVANAIIQRGLTKSGKKDVSFEVTGYGKDENNAPFKNLLPEERFYNRTIIIDIQSVK
jgi:outer membrane protein OmpA-like peptidoglycan-associated protein